MLSRSRARSAAALMRCIAATEPPTSGCMRLASVASCGLDLAQRGIVAQPENRQRIWTSADPVVLSRRATRRPYRLVTKRSRCACREWLNAGADFNLRLRHPNGRGNPASPNKGENQQHAEITCAPRRRSAGWPVTRRRRLRRRRRRSPAATEAPAESTEAAPETTEAAPATTEAAPETTAAAPADDRGTAETTGCQPAAAASSKA